MKGRLWRHPSFLKLWTGETVSVLGTSVSSLALPTAAILNLHAGAFEVGLLAALQRIPFAFLSLPAGPWIDRLPRRPLMIACDIGRLAALGSIPAVALFGGLTMLQLYAVALVVGVFTVFFDIAYLAYLPALVGPEDLLEANQKLEMSWAVSGIIGPGLAGLLISAIGAARAVLLDALSYLVSAIFLVWIRATEPVRQRAALGFFGQLSEGLRFTFGHPVLGTLLLGMSGLIFGAHMAEAVVLLYAYGPLHLTPAIFGGIETVTGLGALLGALVSSRVSRSLGTGRAVALSGVMSGVAWGLVPMAQVLPAIPVLVVLFAVGSVANPINNVTQVSLRQRLTPDALQARMSSVFRFVYWTAWPVGNLVGGAVGSRMGLVPTMLIGGALTAVASASMLVTPIGRYRDP